MRRARVLARQVGLGIVHVYVHTSPRAGREVIVCDSRHGAWAGNGETVEQAIGMGLAWALCGRKVLDGIPLAVDADVFTLGLAFRDRLRGLVVPTNLLIALATSPRASVRAAAMLLLCPEDT